MRQGNMRDDGKRRGWEPKSEKTVILKQIEFDRRLLNDLRGLAEEDGVKSVYQMIRNACYRYVKTRKEND